MPYLSTSDLLNEIFDGKNIEITEAVDTEPIYGAKTVGVAGTSEALSSDAVEHGIHIKAMSSNTGEIYVGDVNVSSSNGYPLAAGEEVYLKLRDLSKVYLDTDTGGEGVKYIGV